MISHSSSNRYRRDWWHDEATTVRIGADIEEEFLAFRKKSMRIDQKKVVLIGHMYHPDAEQLLAEAMQLRVLEQPSPSSIVEVLSDADGAIVRYPNRLRREAIKAAKHLRVISTSGRGTDSIDVEAANEYGVVVVNNPGHGARPVSEHTLGLMLDLAKNTHQLGRLTPSGDGWQAVSCYPRIELAGRVLGIIGLGSIGTEVARISTSAFGMRVLAYDPYIDDGKAPSVGAERVGRLEALLEGSDFVSIHAELNEETRGMIDKQALRRMRHSAFLVNTARGPIVRTEALTQALRESWIRGAALDVYENEPVGPNNPLRELDNVIMTPHVAGLTVESMRGMALSAANQILQVIRGERPPHIVNPEVW